LQITRACNILLIDRAAKNLSLTGATPSQTPLSSGLAGGRFFMGLLVNPGFRIVKKESAISQTGS
jgi:hypothetical protein